MEAEARAILEAALAAPEDETTDLARFAPLGGVDLQLPPREPAREPPDFGAGLADVKPATAPGPKTPSEARK
jgi:hypothetical protein